jgi:two-component system, sensor histidine kinase RegB
MNVACPIGGRSHDVGTLDNAALVGLRLLALLRTVAPIALAGMLIMVPARYRADMSYPGILVLALASGLLAVLTWRLVARAPRVTQWQLFCHTHIDILLFTAMLYMTCGTTNPFAPLFLLLLPVAVTVTALRPALIWTTVASTLGAYWFVRRTSAPVAALADASRWFDLHEDGMLANYVVIATVLAFYLTRAIRAAVRREGLLSEARLAQTRSGAVVAIGALAAGYAHELGTPLGTMAILVGELKRTHAGDSLLRQDLAIIESQIESCKQAISRLAQAGERRHAGAGASASADKFLKSVVERVQGSHGAHAITLKLDIRSQPPVILAEESLRQAITNLVDNAARASPRHVRVQADWSSDFLRVTVRDRGPGFPNELLDILGKRVQGAKTRQGMGMGLVLSASILESFGGQLKLSNAAEGGAVAAAIVPLSAILVEPGRTVYES